MRTASALLALLLSAGIGLAQTAPAPEAAVGRAATRAVGRSAQHMVVAANPLAAAAGREILRQGGSAVDAAIAVQLVLNVVEPQSSGIGGGAFLVHWDASRRAVLTLDGRETAPAAARPDRFLGPDGQPLPFPTAVASGRSVGVPGTVRLLAEAHERWGRLPWARLFEPAIRLAEEGFPISPRLAGLIPLFPGLKNDLGARALFFTAEGEPKPAGTRLTNPALAATFRAIAERGASAFYEGPVAEGILRAVNNHPTSPGDMTAADLSGYQAVAREPVCGNYRAFRVCGMGPPSSGGVAVLQILAGLERVDMRRLGPGPEAAHWFAEAGRLAFADRGLYLGDPAFVDVPVRGLIDRAYNASRASAIAPDRSMRRASPGTPPGRRADLLSPARGDTEAGTSHLAVVDRDGNAVSMTTTIENGFGALILAPGGFLLNNELTDFEFAPTAEGRPVANRVEPGKRPRSSMSPTVVLDRHGRLHALAGSAGGSAIILYVAKTLVAMLDWGMDPQAAVDFGNFGSRNGPTELERGTEVEAWRAALEARGHEMRVAEAASGTQALLVTPEGFLGGADGRREGVAVGD